MTVLQAYRRIFYGLVLDLLDFRIGGFDVLPDFIGYILVVAGLGILVNDNRHFEKAKLPASILIFISLIDLVQTQNQGEMQIFPNVSSSLFMGLTLLIGLIRILMVYHICEGIRETARLEKPNLAMSAEVRKKIYLGMNYLWLLWMPFALNISEQSLFMVGSFFIIALFCAEVSFLSLVHGAGTRLGNE